MMQTNGSQGDAPNLFKPTQQVRLEHREMQEREAQMQQNQEQQPQAQQDTAVKSIEQQPANQQPVQAQSGQQPATQAAQQRPIQQQPVEQIVEQQFVKQQFAEQPAMQQPVEQSAGQQQVQAQQQVQLQQPALAQQPAQAQQPAPPPSYQRGSAFQRADQQVNASTSQQTQSQQRAQFQQPAAQQPRYEQPYQQAYQPPYPPQYVYAEPAQKKSKSWIVAIVFIVCLFAFTAFCVKSCSDAVENMGVKGAASAGPAGDAIAVIDIDGTIQYDGTANSPEGLKTLLDRASDNSKIKAVVLRVNSGGGVATAGEEMATYLADFKKPVVVSSASINASAAYEISSQANYIFVAKSTEIGAIGTAMQLTDLSGLLDMLGINMEVLTSADSKDSSYGYRALTDEEREYYQHMIDQINDTFIEAVAKGRNMPVDKVRELATGLAFTGIDAVENGLADEVGTLEDAADKAAELAGISNYELYDLGFSDYDLSSLYSLFGYSSEKDQKALPLLTM